MLEKSSDVCQLGTEEERVLTSFTRRLIEIAVVAGALGCTSAIAIGRCLWCDTKMGRGRTATEIIPMKKLLIITGVVIASGVVIGAGMMAYKKNNDAWRARGYAAFELCTLDEEQKRKEQERDSTARFFVEDYGEWLEHTINYCTTLVKSKGLYTHADDD